MSVQALYQQKLMSASDAIHVVKDGDTIVVPTGVGEPPALLVRRLKRRKRLRISVCGMKSRL